MASWACPRPLTASVTRGAFQCAGLPLPPSFRVSWSSGRRLRRGGRSRRRDREHRRACARMAADGVPEPLLVRAARGEPVERPPCWMMRQAGRYQKAFRDLAKQYPSFRQRSETTDLIVEITLQPFEAYKPDGVILFSDILTPLPAMGIPFEIDDKKGPIISDPITSKDQLSKMYPLRLDELQFVGDSLRQLRQRVGDQAAILGFVGSPWTLSTYVVEGGTSAVYSVIKSMMHNAPDVLEALLSFLTDQIAEYIVYQIENGAHVVQIFDSWGGQLTPKDWDRWSRPYIERMIEVAKSRHPTVPLALYANGSGGLLERMKSTGADVIGLDWTVDMADARQRLGPDVPVQGNVDPALLFAGEEAIEEGVRDCVAKAGPTVCYCQEPILLGALLRACVS
ncbi:unnamed protein product [Ostreobium quekettii]|uniref:Uroporphyrinogen decarboxylase n=1 Tax=Ostreobium quekettii TaxID=121088 RepID=A0A8S1JD23_9CHLO|nr:unnamed protein product [Ostreobium quekettii]